MWASMYLTDSGAGSHSVTQTQQQLNIFSVLMEAAGQLVLPPPAMLGKSVWCIVAKGVAELQWQYSIVCPLCQPEGKTHKVSHPNNVAKK